ncbi:TPR-like protein [Lentinus tigrinus ALCF2SS1-7]|uniref:TPR-like protein n=1 Tax=Lentinus tigrinus ALCF2SS1-7 TaxID=1328758 RepID=UPI001166271C|nr:TPR-like protein [Lentinus tigrinus ALCF2SS1-7]
MSNKQRLVLSIIEFLNQSIKDGTIKEDDRESLEVAIQCIGEAFDVDPNDQAQVDRLSVKPANLLSIFDVFLKTKDKLASPSGSAAAASTSAPAAPSAADKAAAEKLKATGNAHMSAKKYDEAIRSYTQAIALDPTNAVYYSNRAAAYSSKGEHSSAVLDAEKAIEADQSFVKAYHRLGCVVPSCSTVEDLGRPCSIRSKTTYSNHIRSSLGNRRHRLCLGYSGRRGFCVPMPPSGLQLFSSCVT